MSKSSRHHFVPVWFQKRFSQKGFYVYDKHKQELLRQRRYPKSLFFQYDRNTVTNASGRDDILETSFFKMVDDRFCRDIDGILKNAKSGVKSRQDIETILAFVSLLRLRNPSLDDQIKNLLRSYHFEDLGYNMIDRQTGEKVSKGNLPFIDDDLFVKAQQGMAIFAPMLRSADDRDRMIDTTRVVYVDNGAALLSDRPVVFRSDALPLNELRDFCVSLSNSWHVLNRKEFTRITKVTFIVKDIVQFRNADRYVACSDKDYLENTIKCASDDRFDLDELKCILFGESDTNAAKTRDDSP